MALTCAVNGEAETQTHPIFMCHHCGKLVCADHGWVLRADYVFDTAEDSADDSSGRLWYRATHWREWRKRRVPQSAMHCDECLKEHHQGEYAHTGWENPKVAKRAARAEAARANQPGQHIERPAGQP